MVNINAVEAIWITLNLVTLILAISALIDARADAKAVRLLNGRAREVAADGIVRREIYRVLVQVLLLAIAIPTVFRPGNIEPSPSVVFLMTIPVLLLLSSVFDARDRKTMTVLVAADLLVEHSDRFDELEALIRQASDHASAAYKEANSVNLKIARQDAQIIEQNEEHSLDRERIEGKVDDIHDATVPGA